MYHIRVAAALLVAMPIMTIAQTRSLVKQCPMRMSSVVTIGQVAGWEAEARGRLLLNDATISLGPPRDRADLMPDSAVGKKRYEHLMRQPDSRPRWLTCFYGQGSEFVLATPLPIDVDTCTIRRSRNHDNVIKVEVSCQP